ncbi:MAG: DsbA family protein, partial [Acidobacteria bacterium]|nr:DsbA family protein [Acidobacteriota bacterium]
PLSPADKAQFEALIRDYLLRNPSVIRDAIMALQEQERAASAERATKAARASRADLFDAPGLQFMGSATPDMSLAIFFDYRCGYCKQVAPSLKKLAETDPKLRIVLLELPVLGPDSQFAAKAALAARAHGKYLPFHQALMASRDLKEEAVRQMAREQGLPDTIFSQLDSPAIAATLQKTAALAERLEITGTPGFVVGDTILPGAVSYEVLTQVIQQEREKAKAK